MLSVIHDTLTAAARAATRRAANDLPLSKPDDLPLLMYVRAYGDGLLGYTVEEGDEWVEHGVWRFANFIS